MRPTRYWPQGTATRSRRSGPSAGAVSGPVAGSRTARRRRSPAAASRRPPKRRRVRVVRGWAHSKEGGNVGGGKAQGPRQLPPRHEFPKCAPRLAASLADLFACTSSARPASRSWRRWVSWRHDHSQETVGPEHPMELCRVAWGEDIEDGVGGRVPNRQRRPHIGHQAIDAFLPAHGAGHGGGGEVKAEGTGGIPPGQDALEVVAGSTADVEHPRRRGRGDKAGEGVAQGRVPAGIQKAGPGVEHRRAVADEPGGPGQQGDEAAFVDVERVPGLADQGWEGRARAQGGNSSGTEATRQRLEGHRCPI